jgi:Protein phosphatase 2C
MPAENLNLSWLVFHLPKKGNAAADYEDAWAGDPSRGRFAVADGASEASFADVWARLLVEGFVHTDGAPWQDLDWLPPLRRRWALEVDQRPLPWYAEAKRDQGAFATLLGVVFQAPRPDEPGGWRAMAVGDCCLFRTHGSRLLQSFPLTRSAEFGNQPHLLGSRAPTANRADGRCEHARGPWEAGDRFLLMTDALAQWFLRQVEESGQPLADVARLLAESSPAAAFPGWVEERRDRQGLRNDDVTLAVIDLPPPPA